MTDISDASMGGRLCASNALAQQWHVVATVDDVATGVSGVRVLGRDYAVWRDAAGELVAAPDRCPHREAPLSLGTVCNGVLTCAYHGWEWGSGGRCVAIPSSGRDPSVPPRAHLETVGVEERYGLIWLCPQPTRQQDKGREGTGQPGETNAIPIVDEETDPEFRRLNIEVQTWRTSVGRMVDNFLDYSHFPWVHRASFGGATDPHVEAIHLEPLGDFFGYRYSVQAANPAEAMVASGTASPTVGRSMTTGFSLPFLVRSTIQYDSGLRHVILMCSTPIDEVTSYFTFVVWRNDHSDAPADETLAFDRQIGEEDRFMLERVPGPFPLGATDLVSVQSDRPSVTWRRQLSELMDEAAL